MNLINVNFVKLVLLFSLLLGISCNDENTTGVDSDPITTVFVFAQWANFPSDTIILKNSETVEVLIDDTIGAELFLHVKREGFYTDFMECKNGDTVVLNKTPLPTIPGKKCGTIFCKLGPLTEKYNPGFMIQNSDFGETVVVSRYKKDLFVDPSKKWELYLPADSLGRFAVDIQNELFIFEYQHGFLDTPDTAAGSISTVVGGFFTSVADFRTSIYQDVFFISQ